ncbi:adenosylcobinamide-GDP ribazoletransferase [Calothrix rhizosoleniae]|uniref:adenosylcobinamide-GDP ribazoletransferase n=1 Tax=Calothrix rhizosoleniae TaxID=888997 RepID=UPI000B49D31F|nr:adenosylcobinamide-GDP ribazoletransferase [Calothrix rhizosoleniae]
MTKNKSCFQRLCLNLISGIIFYTSIPLPYIKGLDFQKVSYLAPVIGLMIGGLLAILDLAIASLGIPVLTRSAIVIIAWIGITGGLHLDGAMDTADGLAVMESQRRLEVMADSATGAFGAMTAVVLVLLKTTALVDIQEHRWLILMAACGWGRWGQQVAIACYPYLKPSGKGAFHKQAIQSYKDLLPGLILLSLFSIFTIPLYKANLYIMAGILLTGITIAITTSAWFNYKLGGHTGDTYGAVVEWTEALFLCILTIVT